MFILYQFCNSVNSGRNVETWRAASLPCFLCGERKPLSSKSTLHRMALPTIYPYFFSKNKLIREECEGGALLLRGLQKIRELRMNRHNDIGVIAGLTRNRACELDAVNPLKQGDTGIRRYDASVRHAELVSASPNDAASGRNVETWRATSLPRVKPQKN